MSRTMIAMDEEIQKLRQQLGSLREDEKRAHAELLALGAKPLLCELRHGINELEQEIQASLPRLSEDGEQTSCRMPQEGIAEISRDWKLWQKHANTRRRICYELWQRCSEVIPENMSRSELWVCIHPLRRERHGGPNLGT